jgi:hypothetical protein
MVRILATAEFTEDMAETLQTYFTAYARDGVVTVEVTDHGLWLRHPQSGTRQFLGSPFVLDTELVACPVSSEKHRRFAGAV